MHACSQKILLNKIIWKWGWEGTDALVLLISSVMVVHKFRNSWICDDTK